MKGHWALSTFSVCFNKQNPAFAFTRVLVAVLFFSNPCSPSCSLAHSSGCARYRMPPPPLGATVSLSPRGRDAGACSSIHIEDVKRKPSPLGPPPTTLHHGLAAINRS